MPPSADDKLIEDALLDFSRSIHSDLPLRHFGEFHNPERLKDVVEPQKMSVFKKLFDKIWNRERDEIVALMKKLNRRMDGEVIAEWRKKNQEHEMRSLTHLQKRVDMICEDFNDALEDQLLLNPDMEIEAFKTYIERRKLIATSYFENIWKPANSQMLEERKSKLEKHLKAKEEEVLEMQKRNLKRKLVEDGKSLLEKVTGVVLERSRQLKSYVDKYQGRVSTDVLKGMLEEIRNFNYVLNGKGSTLKESHAEIYIKLLDTLEAELQVLTKNRNETIAAEEANAFAEGLDDKLRSYCFGYGEGLYETQEMEQDTNDQSRRGMTMQEILNEVNEEKWDSVNLEEKGLTRECNVAGHHDDEQNTRRRRRLEKSRKITDLDSNDQAMINDKAIPELTPSNNKQRTGRGVARKITARADRRIPRRSSRLNNAIHARNSDHTFPRRNNPRTTNPLLKNSDLNLKNKRGKSDVDVTPNPNCEQKNEKNIGNGINAMGQAERFEDFRKKSTSPTYAVFSKKSKRASDSTSNLGASSDRPRHRVVNSKSGKGNEAKVCPKNITILKGDCPMYFCTVCKKKFKLRRFLKFHGEFCRFKRNSIICDECGRGFFYQRDLNRHNRIHTGEKPYECPKCASKFAWPGDRSRHVRCHDHDTSNLYICKPCNLTFLSSCRLHDHQIANQKRKFPFPCRYCSKRFSRLHRLKNHVITHSDERPYECNECGAVFARIDYLTLHFERTHSQTKEMAQKLVYDVSVAYLLKETKDESYRDFPSTRINLAVVNYIIKKTNLLLPDVELSLATTTTEENL